MSLNEEQLNAATELYRRKSARTSLIAFSQYTFPGFMIGPHHNLLAEKLEAVAAGKTRRLMVMMPPRYSKSEMCSRRFPAFYLGQNPDNFIISASYNLELAQDFGRDVRGIVSSNEYKKIFPETRIDPAVAAMDHWRVHEHRGRYIAAGVGTSIYGRGAHLFLIDDPIKNWEEAKSPLMREKVWQWYTTNVFNRLQPKASIILIMTRWHDDDLAGRLLDQAADDDRIVPWEILRLPVRAEEDDPVGREVGEVLWPEWYDDDDVSEQEAVAGSRTFMAQYQQRPVREEGDSFHVDWFQSYKKLPPLHELRFYGSSDYATDDSSRDYTVHGVFAVDADSNIYVVDWWRKKAKSLEWITKMIDMMEEWHPTKWFEEKGQILNMADPLIRKLMKERGVYCLRTAYHMAMDKQTRVATIAGRAEQGLLHFPANKKWTKDLLYELTRFPAGANDDQVDALSLLGRGLEHLRPGRRKKVVPTEILPTSFTFDQLLARQKLRSRGIQPPREAPIVAKHKAFYIQPEEEVSNSVLRWAGQRVQR